MNKQKINRRKAAGDVDPSQVAMSNTTMPGSPPSNTNSMGYMGMPAQPIPNQPQGKGNMMNNPQVAASMGGGQPQRGTISDTPQTAYGDDVLAPDAVTKTGTVGFSERSDVQQGSVPGRVLNQTRYNEQMQPGIETMNMLPSMGLAQSAATQASKLYGQETPPPYLPGPMGMMPLGSIEEAITNPGAIAMQNTMQSVDSLGLQGQSDASVRPMGMNMGMGTRNTPPA
jgi:hypothetical protein